MDRNSGRPSCSRPHIAGGRTNVWAEHGGHTAGGEFTTKRLLIALLAVEEACGTGAMKHRVAGAPFGIGAHSTCETQPSSSCGVQRCRHPSPLGLAYPAHWLSVLL